MNKDDYKKRYININMNINIVFFTISVVHFGPG